MIESRRWPSPISAAAIVPGAGVVRALGGPSRRTSARAARAGAARRSPRSRTWPRTSAGSTRRPPVRGRPGRVPPIGARREALQSRAMARARPRRSPCAATSAAPRSPSVRRIALDDGYERLQTPHRSATPASPAPSGRIASAAASSALQRRARLTSRGGSPRFRLPRRGPHGQDPPPARRREEPPLLPRRRDRRAPPARRARPRVPRHLQPDRRRRPRSSSTASGSRRGAAQGARLSGAVALARAARSQAPPRRAAA